jgi:hypothetical protein
VTIGIYWTATLSTLTVQGHQYKCSLSGIEYSASLCVLLHCTTQARHDVGTKPHVYGSVYHAVTLSDYVAPDVEHEEVCYYY